MENLRTDHQTQCHRDELQVESFADAFATMSIIQMTVNRRVEKQERQAVKEYWHRMINQPHQTMQLVEFHQPGISALTDEREPGLDETDEKNEQRAPESEKGRHEHLVDTG